VTSPLLLLLPPPDDAVLFLPVSSKSLQLALRMKVLRLFGIPQSALVRGSDRDAASVAQPRSRSSFGELGNRTSEVATFSGSPFADDLVYRRVLDGGQTASVGKGRRRLCDGWQRSKR
jgi:hypothetical protein